MEAPNLVRWCPSENDGTEFFECELGGKENSFEFDDLSEDEYYAIFKLLHQRHSLLMTLQRNDSMCTCVNGEHFCSDVAVTKEHAKQMTGQSNQHSIETTGRETLSSRNLSVEGQNMPWATITVFPFDGNAMNSWSQDTLGKEVRL